MLGDFGESFASFDRVCGTVDGSWSVDRLIRGDGRLWSVGQLQLLAELEDGVELQAIGGGQFGDRAAVGAGDFVEAVAGADRVDGGCRRGLFFLLRPCERKRHGWAAKHHQQTCNDSDGFHDPLRNSKISFHVN